MLTKVNIIGDKYVHLFQDVNGHVLETETTKEDYEQLAFPGHVDPVPPKGFTWAASIIRKKYDTPSGDLKDGQYAEYLIIQAKVAGKEVVQVEDHKLVNGELDASVVFRDDPVTKVDPATVEAAKG